MSARDRTTGEPAMYNFYKEVRGGGVSYNNPNSSKYLIEHPFRCLICSASGTMKTNALLNLIDKLNCFERFYLFIKMMGDDPLYDRVLVSKLQAVGEKYDTPVLMEYSCDLDNLTAILSSAGELSDIDSSKQNLVVFDDMLDEDAKSLKKVSAYFTKMRKKNCSIVFIAQDYFQTPKPIRRNCNLFIFTGSASEKDLQQIHQDIARELDYSTFKQMFKEATAGSSILVIDLKHPEQKFRKNFTQNSPY